MKRFLIIFIFLLQFCFISNVFAEAQFTSGVTAQSIIDRVQYNLNADSDPMYVDASMIDWVNQGILDIAIRTECLQGYYEKDLVANTYNYNLSGATNYLKLTDVVYTDDNARWVGLKETNSKNLTLGMENYPKFWYDNNTGSEVIIFPTVSGVTDSPKVLLFYVAKPSTISLTEEIPLPAKYDQSLIYYVTHKALERDRKDSSDMYNKYLESLGKIKDEK